jgi:hypothetical protein
VDQSEKKAGADTGAQAPSPEQPVETCEICGSTELEEIRCKVICRNCRTILRTCSDL